MLMQKFNVAELKLTLMRMDSRRMLAFGLLCVERMLPNYTAFHRESGWGDVLKLQDALAMVSRVVNGQAPDSKELDDLIDSCESQAPSSDDFDSLLVTAAQDFCFSVCCLLDFLNKADVDKIVQVASYSIDSVDLYVQEIEGMSSDDPSLESKILAHPLMQKELEYQNGDLDALSNTSELNEETINKLRSAHVGRELGTLGALSLSV